MKAVQAKSDLLMPRAAPAVSVVMEVLRARFPSFAYILFLLLPLPSFLPAIHLQLACLCCIFCLLNLHVWESAVNVSKYLAVRRLVVCKTVMVSAGVRG